MNSGISSNEVLNRVVAEIERRILPEGGLANHIGGGYRPDATAWAVLAFKALGRDGDIIQRAQARLATEQLDDGRVCISKNTLTHSGRLRLQLLHGMIQQFTVAVN